MNPFGSLRSDHTFKRAFRDMQMSLAFCCVDPLELTSVPSVPDYILRMIKFSCDNCGSARCSCVSSALPCTVFCRCDDSNECLNSRNASVQVPDSDDAIRKMTNKGITMLCQHIYNSCTIALPANKQC